MERFKSNTSDIEKRAYNATQDLKEQNKKLVELNDRVHGIDEDINESEEYQQGMKNKFWGFIPSLITGLFKKKKKYKDKHIEKENKNDDDNNDSDKQQQQNIMKEKIDVTKVKSQEDFDDLMARIKSMNKAASDLNKEIKASNELTDNLNKHLEYTKERLDKVQKNNDKILGKKNK